MEVILALKENIKFRIKFTLNLCAFVLERERVMEREVMRENIYREKKKEKWV